MQLTAERDPLLDGLQTAARALSTRTTLPSLGGIMLVAEGGKAFARATDSELAITVELDAQVEGDGRILLPGRPPPARPPGGPGRGRRPGPAARPPARRRRPRSAAGNRRGHRAARAERRRDHGRH